MIRVIHFNPAGRIPSSLINSMADKMVFLPQKLGKAFSSLCE